MCPTKSERARKQSQSSDQLVVCDIMGDWGPYQWSLGLFGIAYAAAAGVTVCFGPILTPEMAYRCNTTATSIEWTQQQSIADAADWPNFSAPRRECFLLDAESGQAIKCHKYIYEDEEKFGQMLTNHFDLVCEREWLRSLVSSASLTGMLISSVTLGLVSDKFGRLRCIQLSFAIAMLANLVAIFAQNYYLFCVCILLMSYAQVGGANALCTLFMEALSPRYRYMPVLEYGLGWSLGNALVPAINSSTGDYRLFLVIMIVWQLLMLPWLRWGVFESIRWLLSEGHINQAQIELRRACKMNRVRTDAKLAQDIAQMQVQQVRKASRVIEDDRAPARLARAQGKSEPSSAACELVQLSTAIRSSSFGGQSRHQDDAARHSMRSSCKQPTTAAEESRAELPIRAEAAACASLSPTLARQSFSISIGAGGIPGPQSQQEPGEQAEQISSKLAAIDQQLIVSDGIAAGPGRPSLTTQALSELAIKYSKTVQRADEGACFLLQMMHKKLWRQTLLLTLLSIMLESAYYGFVQSSKLVGKDVGLNYLFGAIVECSAAIVACFMIALLSRQFSLLSTTLTGSLCCLAMALMYQLIPDDLNQTTSQTFDLTRDQIDVIQEDHVAMTIMTTTTTTTMATNETNNVIGQFLNSSLIHYDEQKQVAKINLIELKQSLNLAFMLVGRFVVVAGIQVCSLIAMESYPNNLRQTAPGAILFIARACSIGVPFLFNDQSEDKLIFKTTLVVLAAIGVLTSILVPFCMRDNKDKELYDCMGEIED